MMQCRGVDNDDDNDWFVDWLTCFFKYFKQKLFSKIDQSVCQEWQNKQEYPLLSGTYNYVWCIFISKCLRNYSGEHDKFEK